MLRINQITSYPLQQQNIILPDGSFFSITVNFIPMQLGWFITDFSYKEFPLKMVRISVSVDMLYQFKNILPFGLGCFTNENREPTLQQDFASGAFGLYVLSQAEVAAYSAILSS